MEDRAQLPPDLPIQLPPSPLGDKYNVILALPSRMRQALMAVFHTSSFGLLIKPPEEDCSRIGQTFSSHTGRTSGLPFCSVTDPVRAVYEIANLPDAIEKLTQTTLRNVIGEMDLDETLSSRDAVNTKLRAILDEATDKWGVKVK